jgi:hypothetical protein
VGVTRKKNVDIILGHRLNDSSVWRMRDANHNVGSLANAGSLIERFEII